MLVLKKVKKQWKLFSIGSPKDALNSKRIPEFVGTIKFRENDSKLSINKVIVEYKDNSIINEKLMAPQDVIKLLRSQAVFLVTKDKKVEDFLKSLNIKVRHTKICDFCAYDGNITIVNSQYSYNYNNHIICKDCAYELIKNEMELRGFDKKIFRNLKDTLDKTSDLNRVLEILSPHFNPLKNEDLTLFDKIVSKSKIKLPTVEVKKLKIPKNLKKVLIENGDEKLLPVQILALNEGLLKGQDELVVSSTGSGKTLVGELAGVLKALNGYKFIFLTPLVALANQKYREFKRKYKKLGLNIDIKVGKNRIIGKENLKIQDSNIKNTDILIATYESIDYIFRTGNFKSLNNLGIVVIDEIHMIDDENRGVRLNGLIRRIKTNFPKAQIIGLSATIKNPDFLASKFNMKLVNYPYRPVPLERHLIYTRNESNKRYIIEKLVKKEFNKKSSKGYKGQTIIFTNSRRKTHQIANYLQNKKINAVAYHAGLSYNKKEKIEKDFDKCKISAVVTTAALAAGVDFPASQVIFDSLTMGNKWITNNEFSQMMGRAGRPSYHDKGIIYLLPQINNDFEGESEESMALQLLESDIENIYIEYDEDNSYDQILADISSKTIKNTQQLYKYYKNIDLPIDLKTAIKEMDQLGLITKKENNKLEITNYGKAVSTSFLTIPNAEYIKKSINNKEYLKKFHLYKNKKNYNKLMAKIISIALNLELFNNAYLSSAIHNQISNKLKIKFSTNLFAESTLDIISSGHTIEKLDSKFQEALIKIQTDFLQCNCKEKPFCQCLQQEISYFIVNERLKGKDPNQISSKLFKKYQIQTYPGDIFNWLDCYVKNLDAIKKIANSFNYNKISKKTSNIIKKIENG